VKQQQVPPPIVKGITTQAPKAIVAPQTGADAPFLAGMMLMSAGGAALGFARKLGRRQGR
jgi:LPXTG-motif cell wall-anchored protein